MSETTQLSQFQFKQNNTKQTSEGQKEILSDLSMCKLEQILKHISKMKCHKQC